MIIVFKHIVPKGYTSIALFPFVFIKSKGLGADEVLLNHEKIHLRQQIEFLVIPFYVFYSIEFLVRLIQYKNWHLAYKNISFEREAYKNEKDLNYLQSRSFWSSLKYLFNEE